MAQRASGVWTFQRLTRRRCWCVPEGRLESRPAIYRRYWRLEFDLVPEGRSKLGLAMADTFSFLELIARRYSGVPPGRNPILVPDPAINRRATVLCPSGTRLAGSLGHDPKLL